MEETLAANVEGHPMVVALAMAVMEVAQAMAVTANVQPTQNHGVRTLGHQAMEETLAPTVEGH